MSKEESRAVDQMLSFGLIDQGGARIMRSCLQALAHARNWRPKDGTEKPPEASPDTPFTS